VKEHVALNLQHFGAAGVNELRPWQNRRVCNLNNQTWLGECALLVFDRRTDGRLLLNCWEALLNSGPKQTHMGGCEPREPCEMDAYRHLDYRGVVEVGKL